MNVKIDFKDSSNALASVTICKAKGCKFEQSYSGVFQTFVIDKGNGLSVIIPFHSIKMIEDLNDEE